jgi:hypothetical protein
VDTATDTVIDPQAAIDAEPAAAKPAAGVSPASSASSTSSTEDEAKADTADSAEATDGPKRGRPRKQSTARKTRTVELILTVTGTAEGEWQAELTHSGKRVVQGLPIAAAAVSRAAKELHPDIFGGIETVINAAKEQHQAKLEELQAELDKVKQALAELED